MIVQFIKQYSAIHFWAAATLLFAYFLRFVMNLSAENMKKSQIMTSRTLQPHQQTFDHTLASPKKTPEPLARSVDVLSRIYTALKVAVNILVSIHRTR